MSDTDMEVHLYWATGCTSCLRVKEFLERNDISFASHNVVEDKSILDEMAGHGLPQHVPIVRRGEEWADGKVLEDVGDISGIEYEADLLPVEELRERLEDILNTAQRYLDQIPEGELETTIPNRPRSYGDLVYHIFSIPESFLEHEAGIPHHSPKTEPEWDQHSKTALSSYGTNVQRRLGDWFKYSGQTRDWSETADVYWGEPTIHEYLERTTWHAGQHVRQLEWILEEELEAEVDDPLGPDIWNGLPMPDKVWDTV